MAQEESPYGYSSSAAQERRETILMPLSTPGGSGAEFHVFVKEDRLIHGFCDDHLAYNKISSAVCRVKMT